MKLHSVSFLVVATASMFFVTISMCAAQESQRKVIRIKGAYEMSAQADKLAKVYMKTHPACFILVSGGGTFPGLEALIKGEAEIAMASCEMDPQQQRAAQASKVIASHFIGWDGLAIVCHTKNPIPELSLGQLKDVFLFKYLTWDEIGGDYYDIVAYAYDPERSGLAAYFNNRILGERPRGVSIRHTPAAVVRDVTSRPAAIGYVPMRIAEEAQKQNKLKILGIKKDEQSGATKPSQQSVEDGSYPLRHPLTMYFFRDTEDPHIKAFLDFCSEKWDKGE